MSAIFFAAIASAQGRGPIPASPLSPDEIADAEQEFRQAVRDTDLSEEEIDAEIRLWREYGDHYTYRREDIRWFFPEISETDQQAYSCFISLAAPQSQTFVYLSEPNFESRRVHLKTLDCGFESAGLFCDISESDALFLDSPEEFFFIDSSTSEAEARSVLSLYKRKQGGQIDINQVSKRGGDFVLDLGRDGCACGGEQVVRVRGAFFWKWLELGEEHTSCI